MGTPRSSICRIVHYKPSVLRSPFMETPHLWDLGLLCLSQTWTSRGTAASAESPFSRHSETTGARCPRCLTNGMDLTWSAWHAWHAATVHPNQPDKWNSLCQESALYAIRHESSCFGIWAIKIRTQKLAFGETGHSFPFGARALWSLAAHWHLISVLLW